MLAIDAPYRAEDAALVPIGIRSLLADDDARGIRGITLVIDENPSPLAAVFSPGVGAGPHSSPPPSHPPASRPPKVEVIYEDQADIEEAGFPATRILVSAEGQSDGGRVRRRNEDSFLVVPERSLFVVADGMGGYAGGDVASALATSPPA